jgi:hypothetical protein
VSGQGRQLQALARRLWRWFFPERIDLPEEARAVLAAVYPALDLGAVSFHRGVPHLLRLAGSQAMALPAALTPRRTRVYVEPGFWDPRSVDGLGLLAHEAFHALQIQDSGWGIGPVRPFLILYLACAAANGFRYRGHPMEEDAYQLAGRRRSPFEALLVIRPAEPEACCALATQASGLRFWEKLAVSAPGAARLPGATRTFLVPPLAGLWLLLWTGAAAGLWLARLLVESAGAVAAATLWIAGSGITLLERFGRGLKN